MQIYPAKEKCWALATLAWMLVSLTGFQAAQAAPRDSIIAGSAIVFHGSGAVAADKLRSFLPESAGAGAMLDTLASVTASFHASLGYHQARIMRHEWRSGPSGAISSLEVWIERGPRTRLGRVQVEGAEPLSQADLLRKSGLAPGSAVSDRVIGEALRRLVALFSDRGYPFCAARITLAELDRKALMNLVIRVDKGRPVMVGRIVVSGAGASRPEVVARIAGLREESPYCEGDIRAVRRKLLASGLFEKAGEVSVVPTASVHRVDLALSVRESPANHFEAALGSGAGGGGNTLAGFATCTLGNLFGTARSASVLWSRPREGWSRLALDYHEPWLAGYAVALDLGYSQQVQDSLYTSTTAYLELSHALTGSLRAGLGARYERTRPGSETFTGAESSDYWGVSGHLGWSNILQTVNPSGGAEMKAGVSVGNREQKALRNREFRALVSGGAYFPLGRLPHLLAVLTGYGQVTASPAAAQGLPSHVLIPLGGAGSKSVPAVVRGHIEEEYRGRKVAWVNLEYRYLVAQDSRLFLFYDLGAAEIPAAAYNGLPRWSARTIQGYGAGIQLETRLGLVNLSAAFSPGADFGSGRLHLRLAETF